ncbi:MAG: discoidin domain-containing protein [Butyricicoccus sp.]|nr:discoidin domain-containing protein [Butyricicoccus sp.]
MSTFSLTASKCAYVQTPESSAWNASGAKQGAYGAGSTPRIGAILFDGLRSIDWRGQNISRITLDFVWTKAGTSAAKTIGLSRGTQTSIIGTGADMLGERIGEFVTSGRAYGSETTDTFDAGTNPAVFAGLVGWLQLSESPVLVLYMDEENPAGRWSENYASASSATITIEYEPAGSGGSLDKTRVNAGETIALTIAPLQSDGAVTHSVAWQFGQAVSASTALGSTLTASFTVPMDWLYQLPNATVGTAQCLLTTYVNGTESATRAIPFYVTVPADVAPDFDPVIEPYLTTGDYYAQLGGASIRADNARSFYGATITAYRIAGAEDVLAAADTVNTPIFRTSGEHRYTLTVTDSRGRTTVKEISIDVLTVGKPAIHTFSVRRYAATVSDSGETIYTDSFVGNHVWISLNASIDTAGGNNTPTAYIEYGGTQIPLAWDAGASTITRADDRDIITALVPLNSAYSFTLYVADRLNEVTAGARVEKSTAILHLAGSGFGAAFGGFSTAVEAAPEVRTYWPLYGSDGFQIDGFIAETFSALASTFKPDADNPPRVLRAGRMVQLAGACSSSSSISGSITEHTILSLPRAYWPAHDVYQVCQGGTTRIWLMHVDTSGQVTFSRYHYGSGYESLSAGSQLLLNAAWIAMDSPVETPDDGGDDAELTYFTYPESAMTSDSSQSCVASVSSRQSSTYAAYRAFDNERGNAWASASGESSAWIQLQMPQALKKISVKAYSWSSSNKYKGDPISGAVMGSNDGALWTTIGTFSGWSEGDGGLLGEVVCDNSDAYSYVRLNITAWTSGKSYVAIGYITITGGVPVE